MKKETLTPDEKLVHLNNKIKELDLKISKLYRHRDNLVKKSNRRSSRKRGCAFSCCKR
jgi:hypothetical protein